jgi:hypothetical protein
MTNSLGLKITGIEPMNGLVDFKFVSPTGIDWFADVKHPTWKGEVFKDEKLTHEQKIDRTSKPQFINGEGSWISAQDAIEDCVKNSVHKFSVGTNNLIIIDPNMKGSVLIWGEDHIKGIIREMINLYDTKGVISAILILEVILPAGEDFKYIHHFFPVKSSII